MGRQRGSLILYAVLALAILATLSGIAYKIRESGKDAVRAELQPKLDSCQADIKRQNDAVEALRAESAKKQATTAAALVKAEKKAKVWDDQAKRLTAVLATRKPTDATDCKAAWQEIRK